MPGEPQEQHLELLHETAQRWRHLEGADEATLLRLALLRDLVRDIHAEKSRCLAGGRRDAALSLRALEAHVEELRDLVPLGDDLEKALEAPLRGKRKRARMLPDQLVSAVGREKLERYDRKWEYAMAAEALGLGWRFWSLEIWIEIDHLEPWNSAFSSRIWPRALPLFAESAVTGLGGSAGNANPTPEGLWQGRWVLAIEPRVSRPEELAFNPANLPGAAHPPPSAPRWRLLYSPPRH